MTIFNMPLLDVWSLLWLGAPLMPEKSHEYLVLCWAKSELSPQLHEIILTLDSLQWQRAFWMWRPISQLFNVNYQPTTCQTLTIKMSATKISLLQKGSEQKLLSEGMKPKKLLCCYRVLFHVRSRCCRGSAGYCFSWGWLPKSHPVDNPTRPKQSFALTSPLKSSRATFELWAFSSIVASCSWAIARRL